MSATWTPAQQVALDAMRSAWDEATVQRMLAAAGSRQVYLVTGTCGEYSDRSEWTVAAYFDLALAQRHADLAMEEERRLLAAWVASGRETYDFRYNQHDDPPDVLAMRLNRFDSKVRRDYTGTDYHAAESGEIRLALPEQPAQPVTSATAR